MKTVVLIKQVPAADTRIEFAVDGVTIEEDAINWVMNPYDEYALEEALHIRESHGGTVTVLSVGPERVKTGLQTALAMGADQAIHVTAPQHSLQSGLDLVRVICKTLKEIPYDLIIAGAHSLENQGRQIGVMAAELLDIPCIPMVVHQEIKGRLIKCQRLMEEGSITLQAVLPILFTAQRGLNEPRFVTFANVRKARKKLIISKTIGKDVDWLGKDSGIQIVRLRSQATDRLCEIISGNSPKEKVTKLVDCLSRTGRLGGV